MAMPPQIRWLGDGTQSVPVSPSQEPILKLKGGTYPDIIVKAGRIYKFPIKPKFATTLLRRRRTLEKQTKNQNGLGQKSDSCSNAIGSKEEGSFDRRAIINSSTPRMAMTDGRRATLCHSIQSKPAKSVSIPPNPGQCLSSGSRPPAANGCARIANFVALSEGIPSSCNSLTAVSTIDVPHFELKEDPTFWLEHNVQVLIRVRPLNNVEKSTCGYNRCLKQESAQCITWIGRHEARFTFDHVACETIDQETLFRMVGLPMVENCISGFNSCMFSYGQTGSGKTYTMLGDTEQLEISSNRGMTPRIFEFLFARIRAEEGSRKDENLRYRCKCSFLEIYNERITDLLDPSSTNLMLREDNKKGVYVENLSEFDAQTVDDVHKLLRLGSSNRKVAATNMNRESSRSHSVFTCVVECEWEKDSTSNFWFSRLNLVDLVGSERQKTSGAEGVRLKEAANINKSLSSLGNVIMVLADVANGRSRHVPYRDSRLTFLLQDSLGGNSKTMIIANVSPSSCYAVETLNTLKFARQAKLIQNNAFINEHSSGDVLTLKNQIKLLKEELSLLKHQNVAGLLSFCPAAIPGKGDRDEHSCLVTEIETDYCAYTHGKECTSSLRLSTKSELHEAELPDAKVVSVLKVTEALCALAKFEEVLHSSKEAHILINEMIAKEPLKFDIKKMKGKKLLSTNRCDDLTEKVISLQYMNDLNNQQIQELEKQVESDTVTMKYTVEVFETTISQVKKTSTDFMSLASDCLAIISHLHGTMKLMQSSLEDIWSDIIMRDTAVSVLHLCHMGVLLETVSELNTENGFLHHGVDESNVVISDLREQNFRFRRELEKCRCRSLEGKLLSDIENNFDHTSTLPVESPSRDFEENAGISSNGEVLEIVSSKVDESFEDGNLLNIVNRRGLIFPQPRWLFEDGDLLETTKRGGLAFPHPRWH